MVDSRVSGQPCGRATVMPGAARLLWIRKLGFESLPRSYKKAAASAALSQFRSDNEIAMGQREGQQEPSDTYKAVLADPRARLITGRGSVVYLHSKTWFQQLKRELETNR